MLNKMKKALFDKKTIESITILGQTLQVCLKSRMGITYEKIDINSVRNLTIKNMKGSEGDLFLFSFNAKDISGNISIENVERSFIVDVINSLTNEHYKKIKKDAYFKLFSYIFLLIVGVVVCKVGALGFIPKGMEHVLIIGLIANFFMLYYEYNKFSEIDSLMQYTKKKNI